MAKKSTHFEFLSGGPVLSILEEAVTDEMPAVVSMADLDRIIWAPRRQQNSFVECRSMSRAHWRASMPGRVRHAVHVGTSVYVLSAHHGDDRSWLTVLDQNGTIIARHDVGGFASTLNVSSASEQVAVLACDRMLARPWLSLFCGGHQHCRTSVPLRYHWSTLEPTGDSGWAVACGEVVVLIDNNGSVAQHLAPPPILQREESVEISIRLDASGTVHWDSSTGDREGPKSLNILGLSVPFTSDQVKRAFRAALSLWHPDRNDSPEATARTRQIIKAKEDAEQYLKRIESPNTSITRHRVSSRPDYVRSVVSDSMSGELIVGCHSGATYVRRGGELSLIHSAPYGSTLLACVLGGLGLLHWDGDCLVAWPAEAVVARQQSLLNAFSVKVRPCGGTGHLLAYSGDTRDFFLGRPGLSGFHHLRLPNALRDAAPRPGTHEVLLAAGRILRAEVDGSVEPPVTLVSQATEPRAR
jgi:hypothetical protein